MLGDGLRRRSVHVHVRHCLFDFCRDENIEPVVAEMRRILEPGGKLFAVYMDRLLSAAGGAWVWLFRTFSTVSRGCHPVSIAEALSHAGFVVQTDDHQEKLGFPMRYTVARG